jgi:hypothetical protein
LQDYTEAFNSDADYFLGTTVTIPPSGLWVFAVAERGALRLTATNLRDLALVF